MWKTNLQNNKAHQIIHESKLSKINNEYFERIGKDTEKGKEIPLFSCAILVKKYNKRRE
ncbi:hypothetical protein SK642_0034 [Streptococcus mitis]|uniref:Uncharacterized protein n=1 Tax=Streptococcus mitis TaxID=28037 RepID=A0A081QJN6_STRMT|nr:hypothetical protein SK642_0034 [Streptococcus mitis]